MKVLDLCCGSGGWTKGFMAEGFQCVGVDMLNMKNYPGRLIVADIEDFHTAEKFDVVVASPPCTCFSPARIFAGGGSYLPQHHGLDLIWRCFNIIQEVNPTYWILENAREIKKMLEPYKHIIVNGNNNGCAKQWVLYGEFPIPGLFDEHEIWNGYKEKADKRAEIPFQMARAFARAIKQDYQNKRDGPFQRN